MADIKISELPEAGPITGDELILLSQDGGDATMALSDLQAGADENGWVRPADWLPMPETEAHTVDILAAVWPVDGNFCALSMTVTGGYTVDWGDGSAPENVATNTAVTHQYDFDDAALDGTLTSRGYKQALIRITRQNTGNPVTVVDLGQKPNISGLSNEGSNPWLDIQINAPDATSASLRSNNRLSVWLERVVIVAIGNVTTSQSLFQTCASLQSITFPSSMAAVTTMAFAFNGATSIKRIALPSLPVLSNLQSAFNVCGALEIVDLPPSMPELTNITNAFAGCRSLMSITFPASLAAVTNATTPFSSCNALARIQNCSIPISFSVANCALGPDALDEIFTALPTVSGQTITITGNWGVSGCDTSIATNKGWTVAS